jgi:hypothetical protein
MLEPLSEVITKHAGPWDVVTMEVYGLSIVAYVNRD